MEIVFRIYKALYKEKKKPEEADRKEFTILPVVQKITQFLITICVKHFMRFIILFCVTGILVGVSDILSMSEHYFAHLLY